MMACGTWEQTIRCGKTGSMWWQHCMTVGFCLLGYISECAWSNQVFIRIYEDYWNKIKSRKKFCNKEITWRTQYPFGKSHGAIRTEHMEMNGQRARWRRKFLNQMYCSCFGDDTFAVSMQITSQLYRWSERLREKYSVGIDTMYWQ